MNNSSEGRRWSEGPEGSLTVYYAGIFTVLVAFLLALFSYGRMLIMKTGVRKDLDLSAYGLMAEYQQEWAEDYGLYMIPESKLTGFLYYLTENAVHPEGELNYETVRISAVDTLEDPDALETEILSFMKERGVLLLMEEILTHLEEAQDAQSLSEGMEYVKDSLELVEIQETYGALVTLMEGIREAGGQEELYVNGLWDQPSRDELDLILEKMTEEAKTAETEENTSDGSRYTSVTRQEKKQFSDAIDRLESIRDLCLEAADRAEELTEQVEALEEDPEKEESLALLSFTSEDMQDLREMLTENADRCETAAGALEEIRTMLDEPPSVSSLALSISRFEEIDEYDDTVHLPYEYKEATQSVDLADLLRKWQGFPDHLEQYAPDEDKDVFADEFLALEEEELSLEELTLGEEFEASFLVSEYCLGMLRNFSQTVGEKDRGEKPENLRGNVMKNRFFMNEAEYILIGKNNEFENVNGVRKRLLLLRSGLNMAYLLSDSAKREEIEALASATGGILLPGVGNAVAFAAILSAWSLAEATYDYRDLTEGKNVPILKSDGSWHTSLEGVIQDSGEALAESESTGDETGGWSYAEYLRLLLYGMNRETRLARLQTLLFLNHSEFPLTEAVVSFEVTGEAEGITRMEFDTVYGYYESE